ncbi:MAG TPA: GntG family PLP-dependent aldolase, partial [Bdellovibrionota bacterium]|nr:GntG family PLP-dependent aldolase [Bdellovibrionota bacterium]
EAGLFVPSGTMANQVAIRTHTEPGDEIIMEASAHPFLFESGALGGICGVQARLVPGERGVITPEQIEPVIRVRAPHFPPTKLIVLENTHNQGGGSVYPLEIIRSIRTLADRHELKMHMDGARLWNACIASGKQPADYAESFDSVSVCLSKGLGAPVGSVLTGSKTFIDRARRFRKMFGGAMRQSGILAAAGIYALEHHYERIREDHENAKHLANRLSRIKRIRIRPEDVETNILFFGVEGKPPKWLEQELKPRGVWVIAARPGEVRAITHLDVDRAGIDRAAEIISEIVAHA